MLQHLNSFPLGATKVFSGSTTLYISALELYVTVAVGAFPVPSPASNTIVGSVGSTTTSGAKTCVPL